MARGNTVIGMLSDFIRRNPKTSATIAFNLGVYAAMATRKSIGRRDLKELPGRLVELVPSLDDIKSYAPMLSAPSRSTGRSTGRAAMRTPKRRTVRARKPARRRAARRKAA